MLQVIQLQPGVCPPCFIAASLLFIVIAKAQTYSLECDGVTNVTRAAMIE